MKTLKQHPEASAVLVRGHGFFVFGCHTWQRTKMMLECYEYLFELAAEMLRFGIPLVREQEGEKEATVMAMAPPAAKMDDGTNAQGMAQKQTGDDTAAAI
jgi:ribulose-5-phosphate 4-epimerase/fuculose-1-phosphate aldolase